MSSGSKPHGFTLVELLVVIAIIGILVALLLPAIQAARGAAQRSQCGNNLRQIGLAVHNYHDSRKSLPPSYVSGAGHATWLVLIMPYIEQQNLHDVANISYSYYNTSKLPDNVIQTQVPSYICPSHRGADTLSTSGDERGPIKHRPGALANYKACSGDGTLGSVAQCLYLDSANGMFRPPLKCPDMANCIHTGEFDGKDPIWTYSNWKFSRPFKVVTDGLSKTLLAGEKHVYFGHEGERAYGDNAYMNDDGAGSASGLAGPDWKLASSPSDESVGDPSKRSLTFGSHHPGIVQFAFGDGSVQSLSVDIDPTTLGYLANIRDGEVVTDY